MTKKNYIQIAKIIKEYGDREHMLLLKLCEYFKKDNHNLELIPANKDFSTIKIDLREQEAFVEGKSVGLIRAH